MRLVTLRSLRFAAGLLFGAGFATGLFLEYLLDPQRGAARRALIRDRSFARGRHLKDDVYRRSLDLGHRLRGLVFEAKGRLTEGEIPDDILVERVRAQIGRPVSHARALHVSAHGGRVILGGPILAEEVPGLVSRIARVRGVRSIESRLDVFRDERSLESELGARGFRQPLARA
jgi:hypothetical protein